MNLLARICDALTLSGVGLLLWFGQGWPSVTGKAVSVVVVILGALILAKPFFELATRPSGVRVRLEHRFGVVPVYLMAAASLLFVPYVYYLERLNRIEVLGIALTLMAFVAIAMYGSYRARRLGRRGVEHVLSTLLVLGYAGVAGALLSGQAQFSLIALGGLGLAQGFDRFVFARFKPPLMGFAFAFILPILMLASVQVGHLLAVPLVGSFILGAALIFRSEEAKYPRPPS